ncbi:3-deoxy-D-manno-octulosonic acid transferase [Aureimonas sp. AU22]|uniref:3-deoxy-D-manno-octulosonic acid transferase n=1 Tax=Aureimonas sp. AU22 TaxID=1638162 RepID=UPI000780F439|nr:3-deoxy-D-manno-octulosonic acid transferase [Aureimonas sp. AU22]
MSDFWARRALGAYRLAGSLAYPVIGPYVAWRASKGKEERPRRRERYGVPSEPRPHDRPLVWIHAASVGESLAVMPLAHTLAAEGIGILVTTGTVTSAAMIAERLVPGMIHQYVPLDLRPCVSRFLDHWQPDLALVAESEIWPVTLGELARRRIPQVLVNARLSDRSFRRWRSAPRLAESIMESFALVAAQSEVDAERYHLLGARSVSTVGNLKADIAAPPVNREDLDEARRMIGLRPVWAAVSTHEGEEAMAADIHLRLRQDRPRLLTIIVPRHVERAEALHRMLAAKGLNVARWSRGELPDPTADVLLGDTIGDMGFYLRLTDIAFIGKSIHSEGGQNPLEAARLNTAILSGRLVQNFRDIYGRLIERGGARIVPDAAALETAVAELFAHPETRRAMAVAARESVEEMGGALRRTLGALDPFLLPLRLAVSMDRQGDRQSDRQGDRRGEAR